MFYRIGEGDQPVAHVPAPRQVAIDGHHRIGINALDFQDNQRRIQENVLGMTREAVIARLRTLLNNNELEEHLQQCTEREQRCLLAYYHVLSALRIIDYMIMVMGREYFLRVIDVLTGTITSFTNERIIIQYQEIDIECDGYFLYAIHGTSSTTKKSQKGTAGSIPLLYLPLFPLLVFAVAVPKNDVPVPALYVIEAPEKEFTAQVDGKEYVRCKNKLCAFFCSVNNFEEYDDIVINDVADFYKGLDAPKAWYPTNCGESDVDKCHHLVNVEDIPDLELQDKVQK
ncbi:hypothetical protein OS493_040463, partial [Desmophyllum pertusum]